MYLLCEPGCSYLGCLHATKESSPHLPLAHLCCSFYLQRLSTEGMQEARPARDAWTSLGLVWKSLSSASSLIFPCVNTLGQEQTNKKKPGLTLHVSQVSFPGKQTPRQRFTCRRTLINSNFEGVREASLGKRG